MMRVWWPVIAPVVALAINVLGQILIFRLQRSHHFLRSVALGLLLGGAALMIAQCFYPPGSNPTEAWTKALLVNLPTYVALSYCFFNFAHLGQASIRVRIYAMVIARPGGVSVSEIAQEYNETSLMAMRLQRLVESGDLTLRGGRYRLGRKRFVPIAHTIFWMKRLILGKLSEFE
ncbi:MAG TPA: hypothetical protein VK581_00450 [Chthoniobacterales bacterium]|nr:hypothetical protein [Chthoniobacterales bacterium]